MWTLKPTPRAFTAGCRTRVRKGVARDRGAGSRCEEQVVAFDVEQLHVFGDGDEPVLPDAGCPEFSENLPAQAGKDTGSFRVEPCCGFFDYCSGEPESLSESVEHHSR